MAQHEYKFRVVEDLADGDVVYVVQCISGYTYGETYSSYNWCDASDEYELSDDFDDWYETKEAAILAVKRFRDKDVVVWEEGEKDD